MITIEVVISWSLCALTLIFTAINHFRIKKLMKGPTVKVSDIKKKLQKKIDEEDKS